MVKFALPRGGEGERAFPSSRSGAARRPAHPESSPPSERSRRALSDEYGVGGSPGERNWLRPGFPEIKLEIRVAPVNTFSGNFRGNKGLLKESSNRINSFYTKTRTTTLLLLLPKLVST